MLYSLAFVLIKHFLLLYEVALVVRKAFNRCRKSVSCYLCDKLTSNCSIYNFGPQEACSALQFAKDERSHSETEQQLTEVWWWRDDSAVCQLHDGRTDLHVDWHTEHRCERSTNGGNWLWKTDASLFEINRLNWKFASKLNFALMGRQEHDLYGGGISERSIHMLEIIDTSVQYMSCI